MHMQQDQELKTKQWPHPPYMPPYTSIGGKSMAEVVTPRKYKIEPKNKKKNCKIQMGIKKKTSDWMFALIGRIKILNRIIKREKVIKKIRNRNRKYTIISIYHEYTCKYITYIHPYICMNIWHKKQMINNALHIYMHTTINKKLLHIHANEKQRNCLKRCLLIKKMLHGLRESAVLSLIDNTLLSAYNNSLIIIFIYARHWIRNRKLHCFYVVWICLYYKRWTVKHIWINRLHVKRILADLKVNNSSGPDCILALVLKQCTLAKLLCLSYRAGIISSCWKLANVSPVHKNGETNNPENYRQISVCSALLNVMESMINHQLVSYLDSVKGALLATYWRYSPKGGMVPFTFQGLAWGYGIEVNCFWCQ